MIIISELGLNMTCQFCYDRPIVRATGHNGEVISVRCPMCGKAATPDLETVASDDKVHSNSKAKARGKKTRARGLDPE
jgi:uncharacterized Zn finger protein (UPF0148 family)